jgi:sterol desaturase/sphingolipid hydroxylase (fatty acid hydroxylase superfamily)
MGLLDFTDEFNDTLAAWNGKVGAPSPENRKKNRLRVYKNPVAEALAVSHPFLPAVWFGGFIGYGAWLAATGPKGALVGIPVFLLGVLTFSLIEYLIHRFVFHFDTRGDPRRKLALFLLHGYHHEFPNDRLRLVLPPLMAWPAAAAIYGLVWLAFPADLVLVMFGGITAGYLAYDWIHYYTHHFRSPKTWLGKTLRRSHAVHHYKLFELNMGISSPLWDLVFGTFGWSEAAQKEAMAATREVEELSG